MTDISAPGRLPQIILNGRAFYTRTGSPVHSPVPKDVTSVYSISSARRRYVFIAPRRWEYTLACRSWDDRVFIEELNNNLSYASYTIVFQDGIGNTYDVILEKLSEFKPISDNTAFYDCTVSFREWL